MATSLIYWKRPSEKKYRLLGIGFTDSNFALMEAVNIYRRGLHSKVKMGGKIIFDSRKM